MFYVVLGTLFSNKASASSNFTRCDTGKVTWVKFIDSSDPIPYLGFEIRKHNSTDLQRFVKFGNFDHPRLKTLYNKLLLAKSSDMSVTVDIKLDLAFPQGCSDLVLRDGVSYVWDEVYDVSFGAL